MLWQESKKILTRRIVWGIFIGIFLLLAAGEIYYGSYQISNKNTLKTIHLLEKYKGELTDKRMETFWEEYYQTFPDKEYDYLTIFPDDWAEHPSVKELFPNITFPITFGNVWSWVDSLVSYGTYIKFLPVFIVAAFAPLFSNERDCGMLPVLLGCKNGREKCAKAKVTAAFLLTNLLFLIITILSFTRMFLFSGITGYDTNIQIWWGVFKDCQIDMTFGGLALHSIITSFLAINFILLLVLCAAFRAKNPVTVMGVSIALLYVIRTDILSVIFQNLAVDRIASLLPLNAVDTINSASNLSLITIGSLQIPWMYILEIIYVILLLLVTIFFFRIIAGRKKYYSL